MLLIIINEFRCSRSQPLPALQNSRQKVKTKSITLGAATIAKDSVEAAVPTETTVVVEAPIEATTIRTEVELKAVMEARITQTSEKHSCPR